MPERRETVYWCHPGDPAAWLLAPWSRRASWNRGRAGAVGLLLATLLAGAGCAEPGRAPSSGSAAAPSGAAAAPSQVAVVAPPPPTTGASAAASPASAAPLDPNGRVKPEVLQMDVQYYLAKGFMQQPIDLNQIIDNRYADYAVGRLGPYRPPTR